MGRCTGCGSDECACTVQTTGRLTIVGDGSAGNPYILDDCHDWYDVECDYGAAGDGVTDDTAEIQAALTACGTAGGGIVYCHAHTYLVSAGLTVPANVTLLGAGAASVLNFTSTTTVSLLTLAAGALVKDIKLQDLRSYAANPIASVGVNATGNVVGVGCERVIVDGFKGGGISLTANDFWVTDCTVTDIGDVTALVGDGITAYQSNRGVIRGNRITNVGKHAVNVYGTGGTKSTLVDVVDNLLDSPGDNAVNYQHVQGGVIANNQCPDAGQNTGQAINVGDSSRDINVIGNVITSPSEAGIVVQTSSSDINVIGNTIRSTGFEGIKVSDDCRDVTVSANSIRSAGNDGILVAADAVAKCERIAITGNSVIGSGEQGIRIKAQAFVVDAFTIVGNVVGDSNQAAVAASGIICDGAVGATDGTIVGNTVRSTAAPVHFYSIRLFTGADIEVMGNKCSGATNNLITPETAGARVFIDDNTITGSVTWDPASTADGAMTSTTVTVTGARVGDKVEVGFSQVIAAGGVLSGTVTANDTVTATFFNKTGGVVDLASGTLRAKVTKAS